MKNLTDFIHVQSVDTVQFVWGDLKMYLEKNEVLCPMCLTKINLDPSNEEYTSEPLVYCESCDMEFESIASSQQDFWYEINLSVFAKHFLKLRGYEGKPKSWYAAGCYIENFIAGNKDEVASWKNHENFAEAYKIIKKYFDKEPLNTGENYHVL